jgi:hypothetical protein
VICKASSARDGCSQWKLASRDADQAALIEDG